MDFNEFIKDFESKHTKDNSIEAIGQARQAVRDGIKSFMNVGYDIEEACALIIGMYNVFSPELSCLIELWFERIADEGKHSIN